MQFGRAERDATLAKDAASLTTLLDGVSGVVERCGANAVRVQCSHRRDARIDCGAHGSRASAAQRYYSRHQVSSVVSRGAICEIHDVTRD